MSKYLSLEHVIRNVIVEEKAKKINPARKVGPAGGDWEEASEKEREEKAKEIVNKTAPSHANPVKEAVGILTQPGKPGDKPKGTPGAFYNEFHAKPRVGPGGSSGGHSAAMGRVAAKDSAKEPIKMEETELDELSTELVGKVHKERILSGKTPKPVLSRAVAKKWIQSKVGVVKKEVDEMSDIGGVSAQQNVSYSESGKKKLKENVPPNEGNARPPSEDFMPEGGKKKKVKESALNSLGTEAQFSLEDGKKRKMKEEAEHDVDGVSSGTKKRRKVEYVGRRNADENPRGINSKLGRQAAYKTNVIDEQRKNTIKKVIGEKKTAEEKSRETDNYSDVTAGKKKVIPGPTPIIMNPDLNKSRDEPS
jgi:hypothetical protein